MHKILFSFFIVTLSVFSLQAQDIHFSQYYANPVHMNPALTGNFFGDFRVTALYRNQGFSISDNPFVTYSGSFDMAVMKKRMRYDVAGVGLLVYTDKAGDGVLRSNGVLGSFAYNKTLDSYKKFSIGIGIQGGIIQRSVDFQKLSFESQFDGVRDFDLSLPNGETNTKDNFVIADVNVGLLAKAYFSKKTNAYGGFAINHVFEPQQSFLNDNSSKLSRRVLFHAAAEFKLGKYASINPTFLYQTQSTANQVNLGVALGYDFSDFVSLYFGIWIRVDDAVIPTLALEVSGFRVGLSYDANTSELKPASNGNGAIELSMIYIHKKSAPTNFSPAHFCPKF